MNILIMGAPGSGKGTLSQKLSIKYNLKHLSTGDIFRAEIAKGTELGLILKETTEKGLLAPSDILVKVMKTQLGQKEYQNDVLLDGFGKTLDEAKELDNFYNIDKVIFLDVKYSSLIDRILKRRICPECGFVTTLDESGDVCGKCGAGLISRKDDNETTFKKRYEVFLTQTLPIVDYFEEKNMLYRIDANDTIDNNFNKICKILGSPSKEIER